MTLGSYRGKWQKFADYGNFERIALGSVLAILSAIIVYATVAAVIQLVSEFMPGSSFQEKAALQDTFGPILTILILLEFNHSIYVALKQKSGAIQVRAVVLITIMVIARKLMLQDYNTASFQIMVGLGGLLLVLGVLYWLICNADRQNFIPESPRPKKTIWRFHLILTEPPYLVTTGCRIQF